MLYDALIIGKGPAGLSCAVYTIRANLKTLVVGQNKSALLKADRIENYYGFKEPLSGRELLDAGESQCRRLGVEFVEDEVIDIQKEDHFKVICTGAVYEARTVLLATGSPPVKAPIKRLEQFEGKGISYCTTCDGFFYRNKKVGVLGFTDYAVHEAAELIPFTRDVTLYTNGMPLDLTEKSQQMLKSFKVNSSKIKELAGDDVLSGLTFEDGSTESLQGLFVAFGSASSTSFALKLGIAMEGRSIKVNDKMETNIPGLYAAGDCTGIFKQVSVAVGQGALASRQMVEAVRRMKTAVS
jgi:thioredoxin reductase (NADPH)